MNQAKVQLGFTIAMFLFFVYTGVTALSFKKLASYFPLYISILAAVFMLIEIIRQIVAMKKENPSDAVFHPNVLGALKYMVILSVYIGLIYVIGLVPASAIYVFGFLYFIARMKLVSSLLTVAVLTTVIILFGNVMKLYWPDSLITLI